MLKIWKFRFQLLFLVKNLCGDLIYHFVLDWCDQKAVLNWYTIVEISLKLFSPSPRILPLLPLFSTNLTASHRVRPSEAVETKNHFKRDFWFPEDFPLSQKVEKIGMLKFRFLTSYGGIKACMLLLLVILQGFFICRMLDSFVLPLSNFWMNLKRLKKSYCMLNFSKSEDWT